MPQVRPYEPRDRDALYEVCLRTGDDGADATGLYREPTLLGEVYVGPYLSFEPDFAWTLEHEDVASGYVLGAPDTAAFEARCEREWWPTLRERYPIGSFPEGSRDAEVVDILHHPHVTDGRLLGPYPAHLHIDLVDTVQGLGLGSVMIRTLLEAMTAHGVPGVHLAVSSANLRAIGFYEHLGFTTLVREDGATVMGVSLGHD